MNGEQGTGRPLAAVPQRDRYRELQALEDAIRYRQAARTVIRELSRATTCVHAESST